MKNDKVMPPPGGDEGKKQDDELDLTQFRLGQDFTDDIGAERLLVSVAVGKPGAMAWFRCNPDPSFRADMLIYTPKEDQNPKTYLVHPRLRSLASSVIVPVTLYTLIERSAAMRIWPVRLPGSDSWRSEWWTASDRAAKAAETKWVQIEANRAANTYNVNVAKADLGEPVWPKATFQEMLAIGFADHIIQDPNDPILKRLRGEL